MHIWYNIIIFLGSVNLDIIKSTPPLGAYV